MPETTDTPPQGQEPEPVAATIDTATEAASTPPWGDDKEFDPAKAWKLIEDLRADKDRLTKREAITPEQKQALAEYEKVLDSQKTDIERAQSEATRWQTEAERWRRSAQTSRVAALAAEFADPTDAVDALGEKNYLDAGGVIDDDAIRRDLADVLERKPHWRKTDPAPVTPAKRLPNPNPHQGSGNGAAPAQEPREAFGVLLRSALK